MKWRSPTPRSCWQRFAPAESFVRLRPELLTHPHPSSRRGSGSRTGHPGEGRDLDSVDQRWLSLTKPVVTARMDDPSTSSGVVDRRCLGATVGPESLSYSVGSTSVGAMLAVSVGVVGGGVVGVIALASVSVIFCVYFTVVPAIGS